MPRLKLPMEEQVHIGIWGQWHLWYIKQHRKILYINLLTSGKLNEYLAEIDRQAEKMFKQLIKQYAKTLGVTEQLKAENQMKWVSLMNSIRACATEIVNDEIIFS